jgi:hypothetical protein
MSLLSLENSPESEPETRPAARLGFWKIALAVFVGNILTGLVAAFLYSLR